MNSGPVPGYDVRYRATAAGFIESCARGGRWKPLIGVPTEKGYLRLSVKTGTGRFVRRYVHNLVALAFLPNPHNRPLVRHLNGDPMDNRLVNLAWGTHAENEADKAWHGRWQGGAFKLSEAHRSEIRRLADSGVTHGVIAQSIGGVVSRSQVQRVASRRAWKGDE